MAEERIVEQELHDWNDAFEVPALEFVQQIRDLLATVQESEWPNVRLRFSGGYDSDGRLSLIYHRPETEEERQKRIRGEEYYKRETEQRERAMLARLKSKYEGS